MDNQRYNPGMPDEMPSRSAEQIFVAKEVVDLFYERLVRFARTKLSALPPQVADEEAAVVSAAEQIRELDFSDLNNLIERIRAIRQQSESELEKIYCHISWIDFVRLRRRHNCAIAAWSM